MFRIGEFSKIAQVPASLLRYYDEIGLFTPIRSDQETGYRYYSVQQLAQLNRILALKDLGFSLEQVKHLLVDEVSPEEIRGMLSLKKTQIEQTIQSEAARLRAVESRLQLLERRGRFQDEDVVLKSLPAHHFLAQRHICKGLAEGLATISEMSNVVPRHAKAKSLGRFVCVIHKETIIRYDESNMSMAYSAQGEKMPFFVKQLSNSWKVTPLSANRAKVDMCAEISIMPVFNLLMGPVIRLQMGGILKNAVEELKHYAEQGVPHPRKSEAQRKYRLKTA